MIMTIETTEQYKYIENSIIIIYNRYYNIIQDCQRKEEVMYTKYSIGKTDDGRA